MTNDSILLSTKKTHLNANRMNNIQADTTTSNPISSTSQQQSNSCSNLANNRIDSSLDNTEADSDLINPYEACKNGDIEIVKRLVDKSNVNTKDTHGRKSTYLHFAAGFGRKEVCEYLLDVCKADPSIKDEG